MITQASYVKHFTAWCDGAPVPADHGRAHGVLVTDKKPYALPVSRPATREPGYFGWNSQTVVASCVPVFHFTSFEEVPYR